MAADEKPGFALHTIEMDLVPHRLLKKVKPAENGRLEVWWRIYDALCNIPTGDLSEEQRALICLQRSAAFKQYEYEGNHMDRDGLQGKRGFAAAKRQHLKELKAKTMEKRA